MGGDASELKGPDLEQGVRADELREGEPLLGHAHGEAVMFVRRGEEVFAIGATCTHYGGPLAEGLVVGDTVRCPYHHARFCLSTGEAIGAPALNPVACFSVERGGNLFALGKKRDAVAAPKVASPPSSVVLLGAGAASGAAAEELRKRGYKGPITMIGAEASGPVDRPNLSKDYLAGTAPEEWLPLRPHDFYREHDVELLLGVTAARVDVELRKVVLEDGRDVPFGALLIATGAEPIRLPIPGADAPHVFLLRSLADSRAIIAAAAKAKRAVVIGASFIGLEAAAALRTRGIEVEVVSPEALPLARVLGDDLGRFVKALHEEHGVRFHLGEKPASIDAHAVHLASGKSLEADLVVMGVGVRPRVDGARAAGLDVDGGILVDEHLETSAKGIYAAGDVASYVDPRTGERVRIEHWVVAERQGQAAARAMLGDPKPYADVPFFWSQHYDVPIAYVGHATKWDEVIVKGDPKLKDCLVAFRKGKRIVAVASIFRDGASLAAEAAMERGDDVALESLLNG